MRLTVGPLPPAVYWRRRALVLGGVLVFVGLVSYSCGSDDPNGGPDSKPKPTPSQTVYPTEDPSVEPSADGGPAGGPDDPAGGDGNGEPPGTGVDSGSGLSPEDVPECADDDVKIAAKPDPFETSDGHPKIQIKLVISNVSDQACKRDTGADQQEVKVMLGDKRIWSSDDCNPDRGSYLEVLLPGSPVRRYWTNWDGKTSSPGCEGERERVPEDTYSVRARLGDIKSEPVTVEWPPSSSGQ